MRKGLFLVLVLVVVLVLDVLGFCGENGVRSVMILFDRCDGETSAFSSTSTKGQIEQIQAGSLCYIRRSVYEPVLKIDEPSLHCSQIALDL